MFLNYIGYGMTETLTVTMTPKSYIGTSLGQVVQNVQVKVWTDYYHIIAIYRYQYIKSKFWPFKNQKALTP